jgi:hypothetical protein
MVGEAAISLRGKHIATRYAADGLQFCDSLMMRVHVTARSAGRRIMRASSPIGNLGESGCLQSRKCAITSPTIPAVIRFDRPPVFQDLRR